MAAEHTSKSTPSHPRVVLFALTVGALVLGAAGCDGGDDGQTLSKAEVISQGGKICKEAERISEEAPEPSSEHPFAEGTSREERQRAREFLLGFADGLEFSREGLQELDAPKEDRELLDGYIKDIGVVVEKLREAAAAPPTEVEAKAEEAFALFERASEQTAAYGFPKDVCGA